MAVEIVAFKGIEKRVYRLIGHRLYFYGRPNAEYYQMLSLFKRKDCLAGQGVLKEWVYLDFVESISLEEIQKQIIPQMVSALKTFGFSTTIKELPINEY